MSRAPRVAPDTTLRVVLDTNVLVSAMLWQGRPGALLALAGEREIYLYASTHIMAELRATLSKAKLATAIAATGNSATGLVADYRKLVRHVRAKAIVEQVSRDQDDDAILACAVAAKAGFLVTGDKDLLVLGRYQDVQIVSVGAFLDMFAGR
jgi:uncharacterized protein